jgi:hypothetical protein
MSAGRSGPTIVTRRTKARPTASAANAANECLIVSWYARLLILVVAVIPAAAQRPVVRLPNATRPSATDFQIGDRFEIVITGTANLPVSVRTTRNGRTDWGPVIGRTDTSGRWSTAGKFTKSDFGNWSEAWTVGDKLADPVVDFSVSAPCLTEGLHIFDAMGRAITETCETAEGRQTFATPSDTEPFRTPDGRLIPGRVRSNMTAEQYQMEIVQSRIASGASGVRPRQHGDEAAACITKMIGANALGENEMRNVLSIIRGAFEKPGRIPPAAKDPSATLFLLRNLEHAAEQESLKQQIAETMAYVQAE